MSQPDPFIAVFTNENGNVAIAAHSFQTFSQAVAWAKKELKAAGTVSVTVEGNVVTGRLSGGHPFSRSELVWTIHELSAVAPGARGSGLSPNTITIR
jgi:hypothetical protein